MKKILLLLILIAAGWYLFGFQTDKGDRTETPASSPETAKTNAKKLELSTGAKPAAAETAKPLDPFNNFPADDFYKNKDELQKFRNSSLKFYRRDAAKNAELQQLNPAWEIEKIWPADGVHNISASTCDNHGNIYFLSGNSFDFQIFQLADDAKAELRWTFPTMRGVSSNIGNYMTIKVDNDTLLITEGRYVWVSQPGKKLLYRLSHFPFIIKSVWLQGGRLMLLGEKHLMSSNLLGKDRRTHFSASQAGKALDLLQKNPQAKFLSGGMGANPDEAILLYGGRSGAIGKYSLSKDTFTEIVSLPEIEEPRHIYNLSKNKDNYLFSWAENPAYGAIGMQFAYNLSSGKLTVIGSQINDYLKQFWKTMPVDMGISWEKHHNITGNIAYNGKYLLYSGGRNKMQMRDDTPACSGIVDLKKYPDGVSLKYPAVNGLYFSKDGKSLLAVEYYQVSKISPVK